MTKLKKIMDFENVRYVELKRDSERIIYKSAGYLKYTYKNETKIINKIINKKKTIILSSYNNKIACSIDPLLENIYIVYKILKFDRGNGLIEKPVQPNFFGIAAWTFFDKNLADERYEKIKVLHADCLTDKIKEYAEEQ